MRLASVEAWSAPFQAANSGSIPAVKPLKIRAILDSSFVEGQWKTFCLDSTPSPTAGLRFHVTLARSTPSRTEYSEPAYYLLASPQVDLVVGASRTKREPRAIRAAWIRDGLLVRGLGRETAKVTVRTLEGRLILRTESNPKSGELLIPTHPGAGRAMVVTVEQNGLLSTSKVVGLEAR